MKIYKQTAHAKYSIYDRVDFVNIFMDDGLAETHKTR